MKLLVVSDTHERTNKLRMVLEKYAAEVRYVLHLGDHARDLLRFEQSYPDVVFVAVAGNCDYDPSLQREIVLKLAADGGAEVKILMAHGHMYGVKSGLDRLVYRARELGVNAVLFGHTHSPYMETCGGVFVFNPGSLDYPRDGKSGSFALLEITAEGGIVGEFVEL